MITVTNKIDAMVRHVGRQGKISPNGGGSNPSVKLARGYLWYGAIQQVDEMQEWVYYFVEDDIDGNEGVL